MKTLLMNFVSFHACAHIHACTLAPQFNTTLRSRVQISSGSIVVHVTFDVSEKLRYAHAVAI